MAQTSGTSTNLDPLQVFVMTPPVFNTVIQSPIALGRQPSTLPLMVRL